MRMKRNFLWIIMMVLMPFTAFAEKRIYYVSTKGNDNASGTLNRPFRTAQKALAAAEKHQTDTVEILFRGGTYQLSESVRIKGKNIILRPYDSEKVAFSGGISIGSNKIKAIKDEAVKSRIQDDVKDKVKEIDVKSMNVELAGISPKGFGRAALPSWSELFVNGKPQHLSRWPNDSTVLIGKIRCTGDIPRDKKFGIGDPVFEYLEDRPSSWKSAEDMWIAGYFAYGYADDMIPVKSIDPSEKTITAAIPTMYGFLTGASFRRWYALNLIEEIDEPGEYVIDKKLGKIYFLPGNEPMEHVNISILEEPMFYIEESENILIQGFTFEYSRGMGVYMDTSDNVKIDSCTFRNLGYVAVSIGRGDLPDGDIYKAQHESDQKYEDGIGGVIGTLSSRLYDDRLFNRHAGKNNGVTNCVIYQVGSGGINLGGGDRKTLTPANNYVENCQIHDFNRIEKSYRPGISIDGVGNRVKNCEIFNAPSMAVLINGNDHIVEYCDIHHVCQEVDDQGALYYGRDPSERGLKVRYCYFHHLDSKHRVSATYHDDGACGMEVYGCIYYRAGTIPVLIGGGHDNVYKNNIFVDVPLAIHIDNRMQNWSKNSLDKDGIFDQRLRTIKYDQPPYSSAYPLLADYWKGDPSFPRNNLIAGNLFYKVRNLLSGSLSFANWYNNYMAQENPGFINEKNILEGFIENAPVFDRIEHFQPIPFDKIGFKLK